MDQMHEELMEPAVSSSSSEAGHNEDDDLESVSEAESNPNEDAKSYQSVEEQGEVKVSHNFAQFKVIENLSLKNYFRQRTSLKLWSNSVITNSWL